MAVGLREDTARLIGYLADLIRTEQAAGTARSDVDAAVTAAGLLAMTEGLGTYLLSDYIPERRALDTLDTQLSMIFV